MILGVNTSHDVAFCVLDDQGRTQWLLEEERYNRFKHTDWFSLHALERLIDDGKLDPACVTDLAFSFEDNDREVQRLERVCVDNVRRDFGQTGLEMLRRAEPSANPHRHPMYGLGSTRHFDETNAALSAMFPGARITSHNHHRTHAASAWYPSPIKTEAAILVVDGAGRLETSTIWQADSNGLRELARVELPHSIGFFYWLVAHALCIEEGQVMGLAAHGSPIYADRIRETLIAPGPNGGFALKAPLLFWGILDAAPATESLLQSVGINGRLDRSEPLRQSHADLAASAQLITEELLLSLTHEAARLSSARALCVAGGVMQNSLGLGRMVRSGAFERYWTQPVPHDAGSAWGAALLVAADRSLSGLRKVGRTAFMGLSIPEASIPAALARIGVRAQRSSDPEFEAARLLSRGEVLGWVQGRAEVGPRALGGRSLIAHPRFAFNHFRLNELKIREAWRPLAPVIRVADLDRFVIDGVPSPHMNLCFRMRPEIAELLPSAVHADGTARIQTVEPDDAGGFHTVLDHLEEMGEIPCIINTSFNDRGEPLVQTALEALRFAALKDIDHLFIDGWMVVCDAVPREPALAHNIFIQRYVELIGNTHAILLDDGLNDRGEKLARTLRWAGVQVTSMSPSAHRFTIGPGPFTVLSLCPGLDCFELTSHLADCFANASWVAVEANLYPIKATLNTLRYWSDRNRTSLIERAAGRPLWAYVSEPNQARLTSRFDGIRFTDIPTDLPDGAYVIIDSDAVAKTLIGREPLRDYTIWSDA